MALKEALLQPGRHGFEAANDAQVLPQVKATTLVKAGAAFVVGCILLTELLYIKHFGLALPTISGTWVDPPGECILRELK